MVLSILRTIGRRRPRLTDAEKIHLFITRKDPKDARAFLRHFLQSRIDRLRMLARSVDRQKLREDKEYRLEDKIWQEILHIVMDTFAILSFPPILEFIVNDAILSDSLIQWLCLTGRQPQAWQTTMKRLPGQAQERFIRQVIYGCERLTRYILLWMDRPMLSRVVHRVFEEFIGRADGFPKILPDKYQSILRRVKTIVAPEHEKELVHALWDDYLKHVDKNIFMVTRFLKLIPHTFRYSRKVQVDIQQATRRISSPVVSLNTSYLRAVPTATLESVYAVSGAKRRMAYIKRIRPLQWGLMMSKKMNVQSLTRSEYL